MQSSTQVLTLAGAQDRALLILLRALLPLPEILLIQELGPLDEERTVAVHEVLERLVEGHDLAGLVAEPLPPPPDRPRRTVVWSAPWTTLESCGSASASRDPEDR